MNYLQIAEYDKFEQDFDAASESANFLPDMTTTEGYEKSKRISLDAGKVLTAIEKKRVEVKAPFIQKGKEVDAEAREKVARIEGFQLPHKQAYKEHDTKIKQRETDRVEYLRQCVSFIEAYGNLDQNQTAEYLAGKLSELQAIEVDDNFEEFGERADIFKASAIESLQLKFDQRKQYEDDQAELEQLRQDKIKSDRLIEEQRIRDEATEKAEKKAQQEKDNEAERVQKDKDDAEKERQRAETEKQESLDREKETARKAKEAAALAKSNAKKADLVRDEQAREAKQRLIDQKKQAEADRIEEKKQAEIREQEAAEKATADAKAEQEAEASRITAEAKAREADKQHKGKIMGEAKTALMDIKGVDEATATLIVKTIGKGKIANVSITF
jgi:hypothetical protein